MITFLIILSVLLKASATLIVGFICYAALKPIWQKLPIAAKIILSPLALLYLSDPFCRFTLGWAIFLEMPTTKDYTITYLCDSHVLDADGVSYKNYKRNISRAICKTLNIIQSGHCPCLDILLKRKLNEQ